MKESVVDIHDLQEAARSLKVVSALFWGKC